MEQVLVDSLIEAFSESDADPARYDALFLELFAYQYEHSTPYRRLCDARGATPATVTSWQQIPPVPAAAFKHMTLSCALESECPVVFHSSGTTGAETSRHYMDAAAVEVYRASLKAGWARALPADLPIVALMPSVHEAPHSSLSFMAEALGAQFTWNEPLPERTEPYILFGTAFAFVNLFDAGAVSPLPEGSYIVETGGFKGRSREVSREELYGLFTERFGVPESRCLSEYGMSEMASQFYSTGLTGPKLGPPWLHTRALDPITGTDAKPGKPGLLAHWDLANTNSCLALQTEDLGIIHPEGGFILLGRAPGAVLRGCSLTAEELLLPSP
ncbi:MAG: hypothetical protein QM758_04895 [Armatimonas sp.]